MIRSTFRARLLAGGALAVLLAAPAAAQEQTETASYTIQAMTQDFDGEREFSQSQALAYARMRRGDESWIELDFGDGAVVIENAAGTSAGRFANVSGVDAGLRYDYASRELAGGGSRVQRYHNTFVRRQLGAGPALGANANWSVRLAPAELGVAARSAAPVTIEISRQYISYQGRDYVLLHYRVPAFSYTADGRSVVQWGEGAALTDPGFGTMYWNTALHRAVAEEGESSGRPYRHIKTLVALDAAGRPMIDPRDIPQVAELVERLDGAGAQDVLGFVEGTMPDRTPLLMAQALDVMALSIAEDSPNQLGEVTSQLLNGGSNGQVLPDASYAPGQGEVSQSMNQILSSISSIASKLTSAIEQQQAAGQGQSSTSQTMHTMLSQLGAMSGQVAAAAQSEVLGGVEANPGTSAAMRDMLASLGTMSSQLTQALEAQPSAPTTFSQMLSTISQLGSQLSTTLAAQMAASARAAEIERFDSVLAGLDRRGDELAANEAAMQSAYAEASSARDAMLANQTDQNAARLAESADELFTTSRGGWRQAEEYRRQAAAIYEQVRAEGTPEQLIIATARLGEAERLVAEAQRYTTYAERVGFVGNELETGEQLRLEDMPANNTVELGGDDSGGAGGGGAAGGGDGSGGGGGSNPMLDAADAIGGAIGTSADLADKTSAITEGLNILVSEATQLSARMGTLQSQIDTIKAAIAEAPPAFQPTSAYTALQRTYEAQKAEIAALEATFEAAARTPGAVIPPGMAQRYITLGGQAMDSSMELARMAGAGEAFTVVPSARQLTLAANLQTKAAEVGRIEAALATVGARAQALAPLIKSLSQTEFAAMVRAFGNSPYARVLAGVATGLNIKSTYDAYTNTTIAAGTDLASGDVPLTRSYGSGGSIALLGLEVAALAGNAYSGNLIGFFTDAAAMTAGSVTDVIISMKAVQDANFRAVEAEIAIYETESRVRRQRIARFEQQLRDLGEDIAEVDQELEDFDKDVDERAQMARDLLEERRRNREEAERQAEAERLAAEEYARQQDEERRRAEEVAEAQRTEPTPEEWEQFREDIAEAIKPDYPTVSQAERDRIAAEAAARREAERQAEIARQTEAAAILAAELAAAELERQRREQEMQRIAEEAVQRREEERLAREDWLERARERELEISDLDVSELEVSQFDIDPVTFDPPEWVPPQWIPPEWVPPEFDPPEITPIDWTNFDDEDYPGTDANLAYGYDNMSGQIETSLARWAEWLATQNVRELERLARLAGYPNLASALADAENIIRQSQDDGYRRWAMQAPSCGGYVGCGPSYLERWHMKTSIVALGDILAQSREIFSSGGFSDVGITGSRLSYLLRDHGAQDGDIVQINIQQFGRTIYEGRLTLTNAGDQFDQLLRPGVASVTILAENEGTASPNTAQIRLDNVVSGEAVQTYNLRTNETAVLRIETNASGTTTGGN